MFQFLEDFISGNIRFSFNEDVSNKKNCYKCIHRRDVPGDCHSSCVNENCKVTCMRYGYNQGWFLFPYNFDPVWLTSCDGFEEKKETK